MSRTPCPRARGALLLLAAALPAARPGALSGALPGAASLPRAHDTWILPLRSRVPPGVEVAFDLTSGPRFPARAATVAPERIATARLRLGGRGEPLPPGRSGERALRFQVPLRRAGIATVHVTLVSRAITLDSALVHARLADVAAPDSVWRAYLVQPYPRTWRERSATHATTFVRVASGARPLPPGDRSWQEPTRAALELVPEIDPTGLRTGDTLVVRALRRGMPLRGLAVGLVTGDAGAARVATSEVSGEVRGEPTRDRVRKAVGGTTVRRTDDEGRVRLVLPRAGRWLLRATDLRRPTSDDGTLDWESDVATVTLSVR